MLDNILIKHAAQDLYSVHENEVVKVAGILRRMRNWFRSFLNSEYAAQVASVRAESEDMVSYIARMADSLKDLDTSIKDLDVGSYHANLLQVRSLIPGFVEKLNKLNNAAQKADDGIPTQVKQVATPDEPKPEVAPEPPKPQGVGSREWQRYDNPKSVSEVGVFNDVVMKEVPLNNAKKAIKRALENMQWATKAINATLRGDDRSPLFNQFKRAILGGTILAIRSAPPSKEQHRERPETDFQYLVETDPFVVPGSAAILKAKVIVHDHSINDKRNLNLVNIVDGRFETEEAVAAATPPENQINAPAIEDNPVPEASESAAPSIPSEADDGLNPHPEPPGEAPLFRHASVRARMKKLQKLAAFNKTANAVEMQKTPINREQLKTAIANELESRGLSPKAADLMAAHVGLETSYKNIWNYNIGNITAGKKWTGDYWVPPWVGENGPRVDSERNRKLWQAWKKGRAPSKFKAYSSMEDGIKDYVSRLIHDYPGVIKAAYMGDPKLMAQKIDSEGYCPGCDVEKTEKLLRANMSSSPMQRQQQMPQQQPAEINPQEEFASAMRVLLAEDKVTKIVRKSIEKQMLPTTKVLIRINSNNAIIKGQEINNTPAIAEFTNILSSALREQIEARSAVYSDGSNFEIMCEATGSPFLVGGAVQEISKEVASSFISSINSTLIKNGSNMSIGNITTSVHLDKKSEMPLFEMDEALKQHRLFNFAMVN